MAIVGLPLLGPPDFFKRTSIVVGRVHGAGITDRAGKWDIADIDARKSPSSQPWERPGLNSDFGTLSASKGRGTISDVHFSGLF
jgi:hypothetical protein